MIRLLSLALLLFFAIAPKGAQGKGGMTATIHPLATAAALDALRNGGNAIDAAVAAGVTLGIVDSHDSGLGGGCFMVIHLAGGRDVALDGREQAPAAASRDMFLKDGKLIPKASVTGALSIGIPGSLAVYDYALKQYGKLTLAQILEPAASLAERGFPIDKTFAKRLRDTAADLARFPDSRSIFLSSQGEALKAGAILKQPDLAASYRSIAREGADWFYRGAFATRIDAWMKENRGLIRAEDFRKYQFKIREPLRTTYREYQIIGFPPPSSGGVHVAQLLNILENFPIGKWQPTGPEFVHTVSEAMNLVFADRAFWLGDPDYAPVPRGLVDKEYAKGLASRIKSNQRLSSVEHGNPPNAATDLFGKHTTHFSVADDQGNWVACTATINTSFGSKVVVPGTGILMNNQMDDFSTQPGVPNAFGLVGVAEANAVAPGKRPLSSMSPTIVLQNGTPIMALGAAGGPTIITQVLLALLNTLDFRMDVATALKQPRFHHQWSPDQLRIEESMPAATIKALEKLGHRLKRVESMGATQAIRQDPGTKIYDGSADPRGLGSAEALGR